MKPIKLIRDTDVLGQDKTQGTVSQPKKTSRMGWYVFGLLIAAVLLIMLARSY